MHNPKCQRLEKRLGLGKVWEGLGLGLVSDWKSNVSVSSRSRTPRSRLHPCFIISKMVSAVPADATEVSTSRHKTYSTNDLPATGRQSGSKFKKKFWKIFSPQLRPEKYAESNGEIRFQIRSQSGETFAILWPPCLLFPTPQRSVYNYARRPILRTGLHHVQLFLV